MSPVSGGRPSDPSPSVLHLTSAHPVDDDRIFVRECLSLGDFGYRVAIAGPGALPEERGGVVHKPLRVRSGGRFVRMLMGPIVGLSAAVRSDADVVHLHDPELIPVGVLLRLLGRRVVYDAHEDIELQTLSKQWIPASARRTASRVARGLEIVAGKSMSAVITATPAIAEKYPPTKTFVVRNFPRLTEFAAVHRRETVGSEVAMVSLLTAERGVGTLIAAVASTTSARLVLAGRFGSAAFAEEARQMPGWDRVRFEGWLDRNGVVRVLTTAAIGAVVLHPLPNYVESLPIKLFEYMAAGLPVVASDFPLWRSIVDEAQCGLLVNPEDPDDIRGAIEELLADPAFAAQLGQNGRRAVLDKYSWEKEQSRLATAYRTVCAAGTWRRAPVGLPTGAKAHLEQ